MVESSSTKSLDFEFESRGSVTVIRIRGRMDALRLKEKRDQLVELPNQGKIKIVLDCSALNWIDSSGVGAMVTLFKRARSKGGDAKIAQLLRQPAEIFRLLNLNSAFDVYDDVEAAVASLGG
jgi:anti-sigma B factor antagonist